MNKVRAWYLRNQIQITWFLIGWLCFGGAINFGTGNYTGAIFLWALALVNYAFVKKD